MYQFSGDGVKNLETGEHIVESGYGWNEFAQWKANGNHPLPEYTFPELRERKVQDNKGDCTDHIHSFYPGPIQRSMALGVYSSSGKDAMTVFIAACIEEENRVFDLIQDATDEEALDLITADYPDPILA